MRAPRLCSVCGKTYWRANRLRLWVQISGRQGTKVNDPICTECLSPAQATKVLVVSSVRVVRGHVRAARG